MQADPEPHCSQLAYSSAGEVLDRHIHGITFEPEAGQLEICRWRKGVHRCHMQSFIYKIDGTVCPENEQANTV